MAVDEWLLETATVPVLRVYRWQPGWGSIGYFGNLADAGRSHPELKWVRRWTGGGTVDHRDDWTYTLVIPSDLPLARARGAESYHVLHAALAAILPLEGIDARLSDGTEETGAASCFENPVCHDLVDPTGRKLAGAGQRRSRQGLLHQGSIAGGLEWSHAMSRASRLAEELAGEVRPWIERPEEGDIARRASRYADAKWTERR
ncbi:hypothetical protein [Luteolibacter sp. LG18]|uniref:lipoyl protein ligase domain-containing protein n=1 Tax=Luteolibacter sp. LG18 TaxID=2819286 RepID=UPI0030C6C002